MLFSSSVFIVVFLPIVVIGYRLLAQNFRIYFLVIASFIFYAWGEPVYVLIMLASIIINYTCGIIIHISRRCNKPVRVTLLFLSLAGNLGILFYFKYWNFVLSNANLLFHTNFALHDIVLPIGISFYTFQGMSYLIDLYYQKVEVQKNPVLIAFLISFFPQLTAGPIVRYADIWQQFYSRSDSLEKFIEGVKRFIIGLGKKVIIANTVGYVADQIFANNVTENTAATAWLGIICYSFQIFFDFSGYSDMAIGLAKMFGFDFLENFNYPYISKTITEFWRRWHISMSSWFRDYVYIPLGGNRTGNVYVNLLIVFVVTGFWHGASFNFLIWGLWHGLFLIIERRFNAKEVRRKAFIPFRTFLTLLIVVIGWVFFRAKGLTEAVNFIGIMFGFVKPENVGFTAWYYLDTKVVIILIIATIASIPIVKMKWFKKLSISSIWKVVSVVLLLLLLSISIVFVVSSSYNPFIYFRF